VQQSQEWLSDFALAYADHQREVDKIFGFTEAL